MSNSHTYSTSNSFTITNAREIASRVAADMNLCCRYYGKPSSGSIADYLEELAQLIKGGYVETYEFGFKKDGKRIVCWRYKVGPTGALESDRPGKVQSWVDVSGAAYYNFMTYNSKWFALSASEKEAVKANIPIKRVDGSLPGDGSGYWTTDKTYASAGTGAVRETFVPYR